MPRRPSPLPAFAPGTFTLGANYWASHAGTRMWADWQPDTIDADLRALRRHGLQLLRVFPLWPDFQPLTLLRGGHGHPVEFRLGEQPLPDDDLGRAGLAAPAMAHFAEFAELAATHGFQLVVGLLTGWMSGRLFLPPALEGRNPITDPLALQWELRFVRAFVRHFAARAAIVAWDLGNECNCMGPATAEQAWVWTATIAAAIRAADPTRPIISGMHSLAVADESPWSIHHQGECTDLLTTHPYPLFTPHCDRDPLTTFRPSQHAAAESCLYADLSGKPCLVEEIGTLGPMFADEPHAAAFLRTVLFSTWAHDCRALFWWCAHDQTHLAHAPYDWQTVERELGLLRTDRSPKAVAAELAAFRTFLDSLPLHALPPRLTDGVCLLTRDQDAWGAAFSAFLLAKGAGLDLRFADAADPLPEAHLYLLPSVRGTRHMSRRRWRELLARVDAGATLYLSLDDALLPGFEALTGLNVVARERRTAPVQASLGHGRQAAAFLCPAAFRLDLRVTRARVLVRERDGSPLFTQAALGRGRVFFLNCPLETALAQGAGAFHGPNRTPASRLYAHLRAALPSTRALTGVSDTLPDGLAITEHLCGAGERVAVVINHSPQRCAHRLRIEHGWRLAGVWRGTARQRASRLWLTLPAHDAAVLLLRQA